MKVVSTLLFVLILSQANGQRAVDPAYIEADDAQTLAKNLTIFCKSDAEKVEAIFRWITTHISYQVRPWQNGSNRSHSAKKYEVEDPSDTATILKPLDERIADLVIRRRQAYCDGYSRLFKTLCDYSQVPSVVITGYSRVSMDRSGKKFKSNHTWNAVHLNGTWHLLDVTWASGFVTFSGNEFVRQSDSYYFLTPPERFITDHYPEDLQWTLLPKPPSLKEFNLAPFKQQGFVRSQITTFKPEKGLLETNLGDTLHFELDRSNLHMTTDNQDFPASEDSAVSFDAKGKPWVFIKPNSVAASKLRYSFPVVDPTIEYVNLVFNDHILMRYRLNISFQNLTQFLSMAFLK